MRKFKYTAYLLAVSIVNAQTAPSLVISFPERLYGWADLHAHPASHLAFGADSNGNGGMFWGKPGGHWYLGYQGTAADMPPCSFKHGADDGDLVRHETHKALMGNLDSVTEYPHITADFGANNHGSPSFNQWPHARSITHQQMHVTQLRRAYEGGQRMLVASVTDNEFLSDMWTKIGYNTFGNPVPAVDPAFGYNSAKRQIAFIKNLVSQNSTWMQIAYSAAEARQIIKADKLAIILSVEMDSLTPDQTMVLVNSYGVRHVIPVHLVNNDAGGTAVYNDLFNAVNNFLHSARSGYYDELANNGFFQVVYDDKIDFRLGRPSYPRPEGGNIISGGAINIDPVPNYIYLALGYNFGGDAGHRNALGMTTAGKDLLKKLAKAGVLIDTAHMGEKSTADTLAKVTPWNYPVMNSHTGLREVGETANSERDLRRDHAQAIADLGGVLGFGTDWTKGFTPLLKKTNLQIHLGHTAQIPGDSNDPSWYEKSYSLPVLSGDPEIAHLTIRIKTGGDGLNTDLNAILTINGVQHTYLLNKWHESWRPELVTTPTIMLPAGTKSSELTKITFKINKGGWWAFREFDIQAVTKGNDPVRTWVTAFNDALSIMGNKAIALGTDINGFAPQLYLPAENANYPIEIAHLKGPAAYTPLLQKATLGTKTYDFKKDGIAHYGMLPDFLQAVSQQPNSSKVIDSLFHSVNDVVLMWEKCEKSAKAIN